MTPKTIKNSFVTLLFLLGLLAPNYRNLGSKLVEGEDAEADDRKFHQIKGAVLLAVFPLCIREWCFDVLQAVVCVSGQVIRSVRALVPFGQNRNGFPTIQEVNSQTVLLN